MYMDLYLMIQDKSIEKYKFNFFNHNKINNIQLNKKDLLRDEFIKFQWPWTL